jgi:gas vesicle protein
MTRQQHALIGAAIGAMAGIALIGLNGAHFTGVSGAERIGELFGQVMGTAIIGAVVGLFIRPKQKVTLAEEDRERDKWSNEDKETFKGLMNKHD